MMSVFQAPSLVTYTCMKQSHELSLMLEPLKNCLVRGFYGAANFFWEMNGYAALKSKEKGHILPGK